MPNTTKDTDAESAALDVAKLAEAQRVAATKAAMQADGTDPNERVWIKHPDIEALGGPVPRYTIPLAWASSGWSETEAPEEV
jgi:hypothetical protein